MSLKIGSNNIGDVYVGSSKISKIYVGSDLVYNSVAYQNDNRFVYSGIDSAGKYEFEDDYDGTAVSYAIGKRAHEYTYYHYTQISTPTTKAGYNNYYVEENGTYTQCVYTSDSDTLTPSWVVVGSTPCYSRTTVVYYDQTTDDPSYVLYSDRTTYRYDNGLNPEYFSGVNLQQSYSYPSYVPDIGISNLVIPDTYNGKPVTKILDYALYGYFQVPSGSYGDDEYYVCCKISTLTLGANITYIGKYACQNVCVDNIAAANCNVVFNNVLNNVDEYAFGTNTFMNKKVIFPSGASSVTVHSLAFGSKACNKIIFSNSSVNLTVTNASNCLGDATDWLVFQSTVNNINTSYFRRITGYKSAALVFKQTSGVPFSSLSSLKSAIAVTIYTDNQDIRNYDWASKNYTVTFKTLSEYPGD